MIILIIISLLVRPSTLLLTPDGKGLVKATWRIERHPDNKFYSLSWASEEGESGSTFKQMDENSPISYERLVNVTSGHYLFEACVYRPKKTCVSQEVNIIGDLQ